MFFLNLLGCVFVCWVIFLLLLMTYEGILRWIGFQFTVFTVALLIAMSSTVAIDTGLFGNANITLWNPTYFFLLWKGSNGNTDFLFAAFMGFALIALFYAGYLKHYFSFGKGPRSRFATGWDLHQAGLFAKEGVVLAKSPYGLLRFQGYEPMIFVSGTGGGKSSAIVIPNCFELIHDNLIITDIKGEIYEKTASFRKSIGNTVWKLEPSTKNTHCYNPLGWLRNDHLEEDLDLIFRVLIPDSQESLWADSSRNVAKMIAMYSILELKKTPTIQEIFKEIADPLFDEKAKAIYEKKAKHPQVYALFGKYLSARDQTRKDFLLSASEYLSVFNSSNLAFATSKNDFDARDLRTKPTTIYFILPANDATYNGLAAIFFEQMIRLTTEKKEINPKEYGITALIDEFANLPRMPSLSKGVTFLRSYRIRICAFVQHIAQLKELYGEEKKESFMASPIKVAFNITTYQDAKYFSDLAGKKTITIHNESINQDGSMSVSTSTQVQDLIRPEEIMRLKQNRMLIYRTGFPVVRAKKNFWFSGKRYSKKSLMHVKKLHLANK